jgi:stage V sporulation protein AD
MRAPGSQWTVTGSGSCLISRSQERKYPHIRYVTVGKVVDYGIEDSNNMGAAIAPACADTIYNHFKETGLQLSNYDKIVTGDLGILGSSILIDLLSEKGLDIGSMHMDCGAEIYTTSQGFTKAEAAQRQALLFLTAICMIN